MMSVERIVLGTALQDPSTVEEISRLRMSDFSSYNRNLFDVIVALYNEDSLSYRAVVETLRNQDLLDFIGDQYSSGEDYLKDLLSQADSQGIKSHVRSIEEKAARSNLRDVAALIAAEAADEDRDVQTVMDEAERRIFDLRRRAREGEGLTLGEIMRSYLPFVDGMRSGEIQPAWIPPTKPIRDLVQYVSRTEFVVIAGRPGHGKSSLLRYQALMTAMGNAEEGREPMPVVTFNLENDYYEYAKFAITALTGINSAKLKSPSDLSEAEYRQVQQAGETFMNLPLTVITLSRPRVMEIDRIARKKASEGAKLFQVDYLQLISNNKNNRVEDLSETTGQLRGLALKTNVPVIAAAQLSRAIESRGELAEPMLSDLRESGSIEQDATQVWFIRPRWHYTPDHEEVTDPNFYFPENFYRPGMMREVIQCVPVEIFVKKNRNGPVGKTQPLKWNKATGEFSGLDRRIDF
jgi:replicative DNA helicase